MVYIYNYNRNIRDLNQLEVFLYTNGFQNIEYTSNSNGIVTIAYPTELNETQETNLENLVLNVYPNPYPNLSQESYISLNNSTETTLGAYGTFTGVYEDVSMYSSVTIILDSNCSSLAKGIILEFSIDANCSCYTKSYTYIPTNGFVEMLSCVAKYFRITYKNGGVPQTRFRIQSIYHANKQPNIQSTTQSNKVIIDEIDSPLNIRGSFRTQGWYVECVPNSITTHDFVFPYDIGALAIKFKSEEIHRGDYFNLHVAPDIVIGAIILPAKIGDIAFKVTPSSFDYLQKGYICSVVDNTNTNILGDITDLDYINSTVTVNNAFTNNFNPGSFVRITANPVRNYHFTTPGDHSIGDSKIGASIIPKGRIVRLLYTNTSNNTKIFSWTTEYLY